METTTKVKLFFLQDLLMGNNTVYSGHSGTGKKFNMSQGDYGKYTMNPLSFEGCQKLIKKIEKDAKGHYKFNWNIIPITDVRLSNFYSDEKALEFQELQKEQRELLSEKQTHTQGTWVVDRNTITEEKELFVKLENRDAICLVFQNNNTVKSKDEAEANAKLLASAPLLLADAISDVDVIEDFVKRYKNEETEAVVYFLENLLVSKRHVIKKATE